MSNFLFKEICPDMWSDFEKLFGQKGACGGCWCQHWRMPNSAKEWENIKGRKAKAASKKLILSGAMTGLLAYDGDIPVGWCSYGPREVYARINMMKPYQRNDIEGVWCINCFFIDKNYRRKGLASEMLSAAVRFIKNRKIKIIEAYPTPLAKDGNKLPAAFSFTGPLKMFEDFGFRIIQRTSHSRPLVRMRV
ncbi:MAG: GNAT family N-acetyltransferase [Candidatus Zixiibacteriota bacterium]